MLDDTKFMSVNQMAAYGLLVEMWKAREFKVPVLGSLLDRRRNDERTLRSDSENRVATTCRDSLAINIERLWNIASGKLKNTNLLTIAKSEARALAKTLPV